MSRVRNPVIQEDIRNKLIYTCMICGKDAEGFYANYGNIGDPPKGACSKTCMLEQDKKPRYPGHSEEDFFNRKGE